MSQRTPYDTAFFQRQREGSLRSARHVVRIVTELLAPASVIDVGCGTGAWLRAFQEQGVAEVLGLDGDYVDRGLLMVPEANFRPTDLSKPFHVERKFDLGICLEVAEHLPASSAEGFVTSIVSVADLVLFSACVPYVGGTDHKNEQWPDYWARIFEREGFVAIDCIRERVWQIEDVEPCYAQHAIVYARPAEVARRPHLVPSVRRSEKLLRLIHPAIFLSAADPDRASLGKLLPKLPKAVTNTLRNRLNAFMH